MTRPTIATEFFEALTDLLLGADPHPGDPKPQRKHSCRWCRDGEREDGSLCPYDGPTEPDEPDDDISLEQALRNMGIG